MRPSSTEIRYVLGMGLMAAGIAGLLVQAHFNAFVAAAAGAFLAFPLGAVLERVALWAREGESQDSEAAAE